MIILCYQRILTQFLVGDYPRRTVCNLAIVRIFLFYFCLLTFDFRFLDSNRLTGTIPMWICGMVDYTLYDNNFSLPIPDCCDSSCGSVYCCIYRRRFDQNKTSVCVIDEISCPEKRGYVLVDKSSAESCYTCENLLTMNEYNWDIRLRLLGLCFLLIFLFWNKEYLSNTFF